LYSYVIPLAKPNAGASSSILTLGCQNGKITVLIFLLDSTVPNIKEFVNKLSNGNFLFTSESVTEGHPDKIADNISDAILDAILTQDPTARVACETLVTTGLAVVAGEITTSATVNYKQIIRDTIHEIGYNDASYGYDANTC